MIRATAIAVVIALSAFGCATGKPAKVAYDLENNFSNYQSFSWLSENPMKVGQALAPPKKTLQPAVMASIRSNLEAKGYRYQADAVSADFLLSFTVGSREKIGPDAYPSEHSGVGGRGGGATIFDSHDRQPVWHGVAGKRINEEDRENMTGVINAVVASILDDFPPQ